MDLFDIFAKPVAVQTFAEQEDIPQEMADTFLQPDRSAKMGAAVFGFSLPTIFGSIFASCMKICSGAAVCRLWLPPSAGLLWRKARQPAELVP